MNGRDCKDCGYSACDPDGPYCGHKISFEEAPPFGRGLNAMRRPDGKCGPDGRLFESRRLVTVREAKVGSLQLDRLMDEATRVPFIQTLPFEPPADTMEWTSRLAADLPQFSRSLHEAVNLVTGCGWRINGLDASIKGRFRWTIESETTPYTYETEAHSDIVLALNVTLLRALEPQING